jgi:protein-S-isoprenylcysteine O-methyltransferase Ste14
MEHESREHSLSHISSYSLVVFAVMLFIGVVIDMLVPHRFLPEPGNQYIGISFVILGTLIIFLAEEIGRRFSHKRKRGEVTEVEHLIVGIYKFSRNPKYIGVAILFFGLGLILNSISVTLAPIVSVCVIHHFFLPKEERFMSARHGNLYEEYKKRVKRWF